MDQRVILVVDDEKNIRMTMSLALEALGMPVHVAGQYRKNTVHGILTAERPDLGPLYPVHRCACWGRCTAEALLGAHALLA